MNSYALKHPRLDVVAIVSAPNALEAMRLVMQRDKTWGDMGLDEAVYIGKHKEGGQSYTLFGQEDCGNIATIKDVIAEIERRKRKRLPRAVEALRSLFRKAAAPTSPSHKPRGNKMSDADAEYESAQVAEADALRRLASAESDLIDARRRLYAVRDKTTIGQMMRAMWELANK